MAVKVATPVKGELNKITEFAFEAATTAADGIKFNMPSADESVVIIVYNSSADTAYNITLKKPTSGSYAAATADEVHELAAGEYAKIVIESARYANNDRSVLLVPGNVAVKAAVLY